MGEPLRHRGRWAVWLGAIMALSVGPTAMAAETPATAAQTDAVQAALRGIEGVPHWMTIDGSVTVALRNRKNGLAFSVGDEFRATGKIENPRRARWSMSESLAFQDIPLILHDGNAYLREEGERYFGKLSASDARGGQLLLEPGSQRVRPTTLDQLSGLVDLGDDVTDGVATRHYRAALPGAFAQRLVEGALDIDDEIKPDERAKTLAAFTFTPGTVDIWTDASGALWRQSLTMPIEVDINKALAASADSGDSGFGIDTATVNVKLSFHPYAVGTPVTVIPPPAKPAERKIPTHIEIQDSAAQYLMFRAEDAFRTYAIVKGTYRGATRSVLNKLQPGIVFKYRGAARSAREEVLIRDVTRNQVVLVTTTASGHKFRLTMTRGKPSVMTCRVGKRRCPGFREEPVRGSR